MLNSRRTATVLSVIVGLLVVASVIGDALVLTAAEPGELLLKVVRMFDLDEENNIPSYFSTVIILIAAALLGIIGVLESRREGSQVHHWRLLALIFLALSFDEFASLHEILIEPVRDRTGGVRVFYFGWVVPGLVFVAVVGAYFLPFVARLEPNSRRRFVIAGTIYVVGVLGVELVEGYIASGSGEQNWSYITALTVQEAMEMMGMILFIAALIQHLATMTPRLDVELTDRA